MISVSSFRPFGHSKEADQNVLNAKASWEGTFDHIVYLNSIEPELASPKTSFFLWEDYPRIRDMLGVMARMEGITALVNADIVVSPRLREVELKLSKPENQAAYSYRWEFTNIYQLHLARVADNGLDFFCASPATWALAARECPEDYRIGHCQFDTWIWAFLKGSCGQRCWDITPCRCVFHPKHGDRKTAYTVLDHKDNPWFQFQNRLSPRMTI